MKDKYYRVNDLIEACELVAKLLKEQDTYGKAVITEKEFSLFVKEGEEK